MYLRNICKRSVRESWTYSCSPCTSMAMKYEVNLIIVCWGTDYQQSLTSEFNYTFIYLQAKTTQPKNKEHTWLGTRKYVQQKVS